jgi:uncharacterized protein (TIGR03435 family)
MRILFAALTLIGTLAAQPPNPKFEVVSIRVVPPNTPPAMRDVDFTPVQPGGQYVDSRTSLYWMIGFAYDVRNVNLERQLEGLPKWAKEQSYAVSAKAAPGLSALSPNENREQVRLMMRAMLADRFHLQLHTEARQERIFKLEIAKGGMKLKEVDPPVPPAKEGHVGVAMEYDGGVRMIANRSTMTGLASALAVVLDRPVIDQTGVAAYYDFDVRWHGPGGGQPAETQFGGLELTALLISNLQDQFGLRLTSTTGPVEYWVVDRVEPPSDN